MKLMMMRKMKNKKSKNKIVKLINRIFKTNKQILITSFKIKIFKNNNKNILNKMHLKIKLSLFLK